MVSKKTSIGAIAAIVLIFAVPAFAGYYYAWDAYGTCWERGSNGSAVAQVANSCCEAAGPTGYGRPPAYPQSPIQPPRPPYYPGRHLPNSGAPY